MLVTLLLNVVLLSAVLCHSSQALRDKARQPLEDSHSSISARKQRRYEGHSANLKRQYAKIAKAQRANDQLNANYSRGGLRFCDAMQPHPHELLSYRSFIGFAKVVKQSERTGNTPCSYLGAVCSTENAEHSLVASYLSSNDTVLEVSHGIH
jgi:hypothetical protein